MGLNENYGIVAKPSWVSQYHLSASPILEEDTITRKKGQFVVIVEFLVM